MKNPHKSYKYTKKHNIPKYYNSYKPHKGYKFLPVPPTLSTANLTFEEILVELNKFNNIEVIDLDSSGLEDKEVVSLVTTLVKHPYVHTLELSNNVITDKGAKVIAQLMKVNRVIGAIHLDNNKITIEGAKVIFQALKINRSIVNLTLDSCPTGLQILKSINYKIAANKKLATTIAEFIFNNFADEESITGISEKTHLFKLYYRANQPLVYQKLLETIKTTQTKESLFRIADIQITSADPAIDALIQQYISPLTKRITGFQPLLKAVREEKSSIDIKEIIQNFENYVISYYFHILGLCKNITTNGGLFSLLPQELLVQIMSYINPADIERIDQKHMETAILAIGESPSEGQHSDS